jgi:rod shape determining protein RodA
MMHVGIASVRDRSIKRLYTIRSGNLITRIDWISVVLVVTLACVGLLFVYSATYRPAIPYSMFFKKQLGGVIAGFFIYGIFCGVNHKALERWGYYGYYAIIVLLLFTLFKGSVGMGAQRWINLGLFKFQPAELAKLLFPAFFTYYLTERLQLSRSDGCMGLPEEIPPRFNHFVFIIGMALLGGVLVLKQPDLGTAILVLGVGLVMAWLAGITKRFFIIVVSVLLITAPVTWRLLKPYQKKRIEIFLGGGDRAHERYQIEQALIAIGSGEVVGKGFLQGTQNQLEFLPESRNDFIFAVLCEELGFIGASILIMLYGLLFLRTIYLIASINLWNDQLLALGLLTHSVLAVIINMGMTTGLLPVVGIPLPLVSYGLSYLWITFASLGWINGIIARGR